MKLQKTKGRSAKMSYELNINKKKYNRFNSLSSRVSENMGLLVNSMSQICDAMIHSSSTLDYKAIHYLSKSGLNTSNNLKKSIRLSYNIIDNYEDEDYLEKDVYTPKYLKEIKEVKKKRTRNKKKDKESEKEDFNFDLTKKVFSKKKKLRYSSLFKYKKKYNKLKKLNKLKAEIIMGEQRKKFSLTKKFEEPSNTEGVSFNRTTNEKFDYLHSQSKYMDIYTKNPNEKIKDNSLYLLSNSLKNGNPTKIYDNDNKNKLIEKRINSAFKKNNNINTSLKTQNSEIFQNTQISTTVNTTTNNSIISNCKNNTSMSFRLRPFSSASYRTRTTEQSNQNQLKKRTYNKKLRENILNYIKSVQFDANKESFLLNQNYENDIKINKDLDKKRKLKNFFEKKEEHFDINKINQEFGFEKNRKNDNKNKILIDEEEITHKKSERVLNYLNEKGKRILNDVIKKIKYDEKRLNKNYLTESLYEKRLIRLKMDEEFKLVAHESLALEKELEEKYNDENESIDRVQHREILNIIHDILRKEWNDIDNLKEHILRDKVMKKIQLYDYKKNSRPKTCREFKFKDKFDEEKNHFKTYGTKMQNNNNSHNDSCNRKHCNH